jgi:multiple antibiotic resistance protein
LLPMMNPPTTAVLLLGLGKGKPDGWVPQQAARTAVSVFFTLLVAYFSGNLVLRIFGISLTALQLAGGLVVTFIGFRMLFPAAQSRQPTDPDAGSVVFVPLTIPSLCGPGTLALVLSAATEVESRVAWPERIWVESGLVLAFLSLAFVVYGVLRFAQPIQRRLGSTGVDAVTRIMGFLLICIGMQFLVKAWSIIR